MECRSWWAQAPTETTIRLRNEHAPDDQARFASIKTKSAATASSLRYSFSSEKGFMPQNLPAFGALTTTSRQNALSAGIASLVYVVTWPTFTVSRYVDASHFREQLTRTTCLALGITGVGLAARAPMARPGQVQGYSAWATLTLLRRCMPGIRFSGGRLSKLQKGRHSLKFGGSYRNFIWPMWGSSRTGGYYSLRMGSLLKRQRTTERGQPLQFPAGLPAVKQRQAGVPQMQLRQWYADAFVQDSFNGRATRQSRSVYVMNT